MSSCAQVVERFIKAHRLFDGAARVGAALSGGPDSTAMLGLVRELRPDLNVVACHVDHALDPGSVGRSKAAARIAHSFGVPTVIVCRAVRALGLGPEADARSVRFAALAELAADLRLDTICLGHTLDDRAETLLLNLLRGTGLDGLAVLPQVGVLPVLGSRCRLVRPILALRRDETRAWCERSGIAPVADPANEDPAPARNQVRVRVLPLLEELRPGAVTRLAATAELLASERAALNDAAAGVTGVVTDAGPFHVAFARAALQAVCQTGGGGGEAGAIVTRRVRAELARLLGGRPPSRAATRQVMAAKPGTLPSTRLSVRLEGKALVVFDLAASMAQMASVAPVALQIPGRTDAFALRIDITASTFHGPLAVRPLQRGERREGARRTIRAELERADVSRRFRDHALAVVCAGQVVAALAPGGVVPRSSIIGNVMWRPVGE